MTDPIPEIEFDPKAAVASYIRELEEYYYRWYDRATSRNFIYLSIAQALALLSGFATALIAALLNSEQFKGWTLGRILLRVTSEARAEFAAASTPEQYSTLHRALIAEVSDLEDQQSRGFQRLIPKSFSFTRRPGSGR